MNAPEILRSQVAEPPAGSSAGQILVACCRGLRLQVAMPTPQKVPEIVTRLRQLEYPQPF